MNLCSYRKIFVRSFVLSFIALNSSILLFARLSLLQSFLGIDNIDIRKEGKKEEPVPIVYVSM